MTTQRPTDIRDNTAEEYWADFEHKWTTLITYRYLGRRTPPLDAGVEGNVVMPLRHDMRNAAGGVMAAVLCLASPETGGIIDDVFVPAPVIASMQILDDGRDVSTIMVESEVIRTGRYMGFSRALIVDADHPDRLIALSSGMGVTLGDTPGNYQKVDNPPIEVVDSPSLPPLHQVFGAVRRPDGAWTLPELSVELASLDASLHIGPQHVVLEAAATELAADRAGTDLLQVEDWQVMFVARAKTGPFRVSGSSFPGRRGRIGCRLALHDEGNNDRVVTTASATLRPFDPD